MASSIKQLSDGGPLGTSMGQSATDLIAFHGGTVTSRRASAALSVSLSIFINTGLSIVTGNSFGVVSTQMGNLIDAVAEIRAVLRDYNLHKAGA